jgi:hypothetical protein
MPTIMTNLRALAVVTLAAAALFSFGSGRGSAQATQATADFGRKNLIVYGDMSVFWGRGGNPENCALKSRYKRGEPVGFRVFVQDPLTGKREESAQLVVHLNYAGKVVDLPMRYRATAAQPERQFWVAKWVVPTDAPTGIIRYTVTAADKNGRTGEFKPFDVDSSQLTIVE